MFDNPSGYEVRYDSEGGLLVSPVAPVKPNFTGQKNNLLAQVGPMVTDDETKGYEVGSRWIVGAEVYTCINAIATNAIWQRQVLVEYEQEDSYIVGSVVSFENCIYRARESVPASTFFNDVKWVKVLDGGDYRSELMVDNALDAVEKNLKYINYNGVDTDIYFSDEFNRTFLFRNFSDNDVKLFIKDHTTGDISELEGKMIKCPSKFSMRIALDNKEILWANEENALIDDIVLRDLLVLFNDQTDAAIAALEAQTSSILDDYNSKNISAYESWKAITGNASATEPEFVDSIVSAFRHGTSLPPASGSQTVFFNFVEGEMFIDIFDVTGNPKWELWVNSSTTSFELDVAISLTNLTREVLTNSNNNADLLVRVTNLENA